MPYSNTAITRTVPNHDVKALLGDLAIWFFIFMELAVFGIFFCVYAYTRSTHLELFHQYQLSLNQSIGFTNTLLLITSSYFFVNAVTAIRQDEEKQCIRWLSWGILLGIFFLILKSYEFHEKFSQGISLDTNTFYMFYLSLTMFHQFHVALGVVIMIAILWNTKNHRYDSDNHTGIETGAVYWHMVDLVWIILFPLVYIL